MMKIEAEQEEWYETCAAMLRSRVDGFIYLAILDVETNFSLPTHMGLYRDQRMKEKAHQESYTYEMLLKAVNPAVVCHLAPRVCSSREEAGVRRDQKRQVSRRRMQPNDDRLCSQLGQREKSLD
jgi:hypothetical protein